MLFTGLRIGVRGGGPGGGEGGGGGGGGGGVGGCTSPPPKKNSGRVDIYSGKRYASTSYFFATVTRVLCSLTVCQGD